MNSERLYHPDPLIDAEVNRLLPLAAWLRDHEAQGGTAAAAKQ